MLLVATYLFTGVLLTSVFMKLTNFPEPSGEEYVPLAFAALLWPVFLVLVIVSLLIKLTLTALKVKE